MGVTEQDPYRRTARFYDAIFEPFLGGLRRDVLGFARPRREMRVLEVGCGTGSNLALFLGEGCAVAGIDTSSAMVGSARAKLGEGADLRVGDAAEMPFGDGTFDLVIAFLTLHEMPSALRQAVVTDMSRVASRDGRLLLVDFHTRPYAFPMGWLYRSAIVPVEIAAGREHFRNHRDMLRRGGIPGLVRSSGLELEREMPLLGGNLRACLARPAPS
jgi:ubiquinone/menaquinone biosynthesis C-methylase UbiE